MNENNTIKKMESGILRGRKNASFERHIMHTEREGFVVVFIGVGLFGVGIAWNVSTHFQFKNVSISNTPVAEEAVVYRAGLVESALADFEVRKQEYEELKNHLRQIQLRFRQANQKKERCQEKRCWLFRDGVLGHESLSIFVRLRLQIY